MEQSGQIYIPEEANQVKEKEKRIEEKLLKRAQANVFKTK